MRKEAPEYQMASGLMPATKLASTDILIQAVQYIALNDELAIEFDVISMIVSALKQQGLNNIEDYRRSEEDKKEYIAQLQAATAAKTPETSQPQDNQDG